MSLGPRGLEYHGEPKTFEERIEERIERQIKLAEESNRIMERIASSLESIVKHNTWSRSNG